MLELPPVANHRLYLVIASNSRPSGKPCNSLARHLHDHRSVQDAWWSEISASKRSWVRAMWEHFAVSEKGCINDGNIWLTACKSLCQLYYFVSWENRQKILYGSYFHSTKYCSMFLSHPSHSFPMVATNTTLNFSWQMHVDESWTTKTWVNVVILIILLVVLKSFIVSILHVVLFILVIGTHRVIFIIAMLNTILENWFLISVRFHHKIL